MGSIPGSGRSPEGGNGNPLQYSCLGNPRDRGARRATRVRHDLATKTTIFHCIYVQYPITSWEIDGETGNSVRLYFFRGGGAPKSLHMVTAAMKLKDAYSLEGKL